MVEEEKTAEVTVSTVRETTSRGGATGSRKGRGRGAK